MDEGVPQFTRLKDSIEKEGTFIEIRGRWLTEMKSKLDLPEKGKLYYPACGGDFSPSLAFPEWEILYLDPVVHFSDLEDKSKNVQLIRGDLTRPPFGDEASFDIVMVVSPGSHLSSERVITPTTKNLKVGGILVCDNWHGTEDFVRNNLSDTFEEVEIGKGADLTAFRKKR